MRRVKIALDDASLRIARRPGRSLLVSLGAALGIGMFVAVVSLGTSAAFNVQRRFDALKATEVVLVADPTSGFDFPNDTDERLARIPGVVTGGRLGNAGGVVVAGGNGPTNRHVGAELIGLSSGAMSALGLEVVAGRLPLDLGDQTPVREAVVGALVADDLYVEYGALPQWIALDGVPYLLVGVVEAGGSRPELIGAVVVTDHQVLRAGGTIPEAVIRVELGAAESVASAAPIALSPSEPEQLVALVPPDPRRLSVEVAGTLDGLGGFVVAVLLLGGTLVIGATSFASVVERQKEIGMRRAVGAGPADIVLMVIFESGAIGWLGGIVGSSVALVTVVVFAQAEAWDPVIDPRLALLAPLGGLLSGLVGGLLPAIRAVRISPAEALRQ